MKAKIGEEAIVVPMEKSWDLMDFATSGTVVALQERLDRLERQAIADHKAIKGILALMGSAATQALKAHLELMGKTA